MIYQKRGKNISTKGFCATCEFLHSLASSVIFSVNAQTHGNIEFIF